MPISSPNSAARIRLPHPLLPSSLQRNSRNSPLILHRNLLPTLFLYPFSLLRCSQTVSYATAENCSVEFESMDLEKKYAWELEVAVKAVHMTALLCRRARSPNLRKINPRVPFQEAFYLYSSSFTFFKGFSLSNFTPPQLASMATEELIKSPSLPLYPQMGGCEEGPNTCTNKTCHGHEVDIPHFSLGNAIPGRLYGRNPVDNRQGYGGDRYGHLVDLYGWNPHCRYLDGLGPSENDTTAQNDWQGSWWHSSLTDHSED